MLSSPIEAGLAPATWAPTICACQVCLRNCEVLYKIRPPHQGWRWICGRCAWVMIEPSDNIPSDSLNLPHDVILEEGRMELHHIPYFKWMPPHIREMITRMLPDYHQLRRLPKPKRVRTYKSPWTGHWRTKQVGVVEYVLREYKIL